MSSMSLSEFMLARIAEDEALARSAEERALTPWRATYGRQVEARHDGYLVTPEDEHSYSTDPPDEVALHIARWDPARVLAECEAKRRIVEAHPLVTDPQRLVKVWTRASPGNACETCGGNPVDSSAPIEDIGPCDTLLALAAIYADHPDCREEWKL